MNSQIQLLNDCQIRVGQVTLSPWPRFQIDGSCDDLPKLVSSLLNSQDVAAALWYAKIPGAIREKLLTFPEALLPDLMTLSQMHPERFLDWSQWCPALLALLCRLKADDGAPWDDFDRLRAMQAGWRVVLERSGWEPTRPNLNLLRKVSIESVTLVNLLELQQHCQDRRKRMLLSHVSTITTLTLDTLHLPSWMLSVRLLALDENDVFALDVESVRQICLALLRYRQELGIEPLWPYRKGRLSIHTLHGAEQVHKMYASFERPENIPPFPEPPLSAIRSSRFHVEPLTSIAKLNAEGTSMQNCLITYAMAILKGQYYAYKLIHPERCTVLLLRNQSGDWIPAQVKAFSNAIPKPETIELIEKWLGTKIEKEVMDDFPF